MLFRLIRPAVFALDSETGHRLALRALGALPARSPAPAEALAVEVAGLRGGRGHARLVPLETVWVREVARPPRRTRA